MKKKTGSGAMDAEQLEAIRHALSELRRPRTDIPFRPIVEIARALERSNVTLDLEAERRIGVPVVIVRPRASASAACCGTLTAREREVAERVAAGLSNAAIARELRIALATVKDHVHNALRKSGLRTRTALAASIVRGEL